MSHGDLYKDGFGHTKHHEKEPEFDPSEKVPAWANVLCHQLALLIREVRNMKQSTTDLINATNALIDNSANVDAAIDALVAASSNEDETAVTAAVEKLKSLKSDQNTHLAKLVAAVPAAAAAPADTAPVAVNPVPQPPVA